MSRENEENRMSKNAVVKEKQRNVVQYSPKKGLKKIDNAKAGEERARRARDADGMFREITKKMKAQGEYIVWRDAATAEVKTMRSGPGRGKKGPKKELSEVRVSFPDDDPGEKTAHRWRKDFCSKVEKEVDGKTKRVTIIDKEKFQRALEDSKRRALRVCEREPTGTERGTTGTGEIEWYTPAPYIEAARKVFGEIDLDPASCEIAQQTVQAARYFTIADDGLEQEWHGNVWLNPPYHTSLIPAFIAKLIEELRAGHTTAAITLTNNSTDTYWFRDAYAACAAICFTHGRIKFVDANGIEISPTQGQAFFYFGDDVEKFARVFADIGSIFIPYRQPLAHLLDGDGMPAMKTETRWERGDDATMAALWKLWKAA